jgi:DNA-binding ferritin-like protein
MPTKKNVTRKIKRVQKKSSKISQKFEQTLVLVFLEMLNTVKLFHWKTQSFATHKATDELYGQLNETIDKFVEILLGKFGNRVDLTSIKSIPLNDFSTQEQFIKKVMQYKEFLVSLDTNPAMKSMSNTDLYNIRDEMLGHFNQLLYLLTFK